MRSWCWAISAVTGPANAMCSTMPTPVMTCRWICWTSSAFSSASLPSTLAGTLTMPMSWIKAASSAASTSSVGHCKRRASVPTRSATRRWWPIESGSCTSKTVISICTTPIRACPSAEPASGRWRSALSDTNVHSTRRRSANSTGRAVNHKGRRPWSRVSAVTGMAGMGKGRLTREISVRTTCGCGHQASSQNKLSCMTDAAWPSHWGQAGLRRSMRPVTGSTSTRPALACASMSWSGSVNFSRVIRKSGPS